MIAADEMEMCSGVADFIQGVKKFVVTRQSEMGIVEPEIEDITQQEQVVHTSGRLEEP